jgi:hypothetical protein
MLREGESPDFEISDDGSARGTAPTTIQDPALNRALDFLKGLAVVRANQTH